MSEFIHKSHNATILLYHLVFLAKYRRVVFDKGVDRALTEICLEIEKRYEVKFLEIGTDEDHVHCVPRSGGIQEEEVTCFRRDESRPLGLGFQELGLNHY